LDILIIWISIFFSL